ncbi:Uncharacterized conserved protein, DUF1800 family [Variovorax sp. HW608]|uniref:DUF1800 domain-containing protein n=1 Tax=Variovorax sp. HW608 TaxID=1034889 RepID=UPI00082018FF|nr:DUF1800 domain-containing protein [Variovorax sp. HW608]SCK50200.1 Uncharacterized conserved protein, DUF1800 family [Variovorax sp. HW608]
MRTPPRAAVSGLLLASSLLLGACAASAGQGSRPKVAAADETTQLRWLERVTWGADAGSTQDLKRLGLPEWLREQLHPRPAALPPAAQAQIDAMTISRTPVETIVMELRAQRRAMNEVADEEQKKEARKTLQQDLTRLTREAQQRFVLRALYSPNQLEEQMTWFWTNHFNVNARKANLRALVGDYEESAVRPHALGRFRDLLGATLHHPAMLLYLDNAQNAADRVNENYARELMELHTLGVGGGYSQADVQELARVLTGVGIRVRGADAAPPRLPPELRGDYVQQGLFEFNPNRHDYGPKTLVGQAMTQRGLAEVDEALDRLARAPATARFISRKLAVYFVADDPPPALVGRMAETFRQSDGDIAATLQTMFESREFAASLGRKFRDPVHYVIASVRLADDGRIVSNLNPMLQWMYRMGEPLYGHETPDGYPMTEDAWASAGQMTTRFEIARAIGANGGVLLRRDDGVAGERPAPPALAESPVVRQSLSSMSVETREALAEARSPQDWNTFLLASPERMHR